ncbi:hypothetical protein DM02DRAFT_634501 [Periconia macrospinosa]|uniref:Uncharacterized protein n=1 Tax=Periconia macrospinosa TaxID=97972 RepID=A0A2V1D633_9PLEO|nr:hypothetical protein DM02DRAFT_634501 [Periconia macrospinosa]
MTKDTPLVLSERTRALRLDLHNRAGTTALIALAQSTVPMNGEDRRLTVSRTVMTIQFGDFSVRSIASAYTVHSKLLKAIVALLDIDLPASKPTKTGQPHRKPRKHLNASAAAEAKKDSDRRRYQRSRGLGGPAKFIHYAPALPGAPSNTNPDLGLRISADVSIPRDPLIQPDELLVGEDVYRPLSPLMPLAVGDVGAAAVISQLYPQIPNDFDSISFIYYDISKCKN